MGLDLMQSCQMAWQVGSAGQLHLSQTKINSTTDYTGMYSIILEKCGDNHRLDGILFTLENSKTTTVTNEQSIKEILLDKKLS